MARKITRIVAGSSALALALLVPVTSAVAQDAEPVITNTETVNVTLDPTGAVDVARIYDQIAIQGSGDISYENPVSTAGLRNLDSFGGFSVEDGSIVEETSVDGQLRRRSLSDFDQDLPVTVKVTYTLDGTELAPSDLVGKTGELEVTYRVENMTGATEEVEFVNFKGETLTKDEMVYDPMAGSLTMTLPSTFTDITSESGAVIAGDGRGGTKLSFSVTLIPPLGDPVAEVSYRAKVENAAIPPANLTFIPVVISNNPTVTGAKESYEGGAQTGRDLAAGATEIDANVLKLADGAGGLVKGLILLRGGATQLSRGLVDDAAPGAGTLAAGLGELKGNIPALVDGLDTLDGGATQVADGVSGLNDGLTLLYNAVEDLPASVKAKLKKSPDYQALLGGLDQIIAGLRFPGKTDCEVALAGGDPKSCGAMDAVELISGLLATGATDVSTKLVPLTQGLYFGKWGTTPCGSPPNVAPPASSPPGNYCDAVSSLYYGLIAPRETPGFPNGGLGTQAGTAAKALEKTYTGVDAKLVPGLESVKAGIPTLVDSILDGVQQQLLDALGVPKAGCDPTKTLRCGSSALVDGSAQVADGASQLNEAVGPLADGIDQLADGSTTLAEGLASAADGSGVLASGLKEAAADAPALPEGAKRLSKEGTSQLIEAGRETAENYATQVATLVASAKRTTDGGLPYGPPEDALRFAAYSYDIDGADASQAQNVGRLVAALVVGAGAVGGATWFARRRSSTA